MSYLIKSAAELVGAGMQATGVAIPVGPVSAKLIDGMHSCGLPVLPKSWFKYEDGSNAVEAKSKSSSEKNVYDKLEHHINGLIQVAKSSVELKRILSEGCCKSAERLTVKDQQPRMEVRYFTPQKHSSGTNVFSEPPKSSSAEVNSFQKKFSKDEKKSVQRQDDEKDTSPFNLRRRLNFEKACTSCLTKSRTLLQMPCGALICTKCDEIQPHEDECKECQKLLR